MNRETTILAATVRAAAFLITMYFVPLGLLAGAVELGWHA